MQDIQDYSITGGGGGGGGGEGMFFGGGIGGGDRRMRTHQNNILNQHLSLKCPRCNSLNTKFCYYNNYNLSQPRHFCKNCRRYWTKGGVLRNVPIGGGCRKAKRSKSKQPTSSSPSSADKPTTPTQDVEDKSSSSESQSSSLTAAAVATCVTDVPHVKLYENGIEWSTLLGQGSSDGGGFAEIETTPFGFGCNSVDQQCIQGDRTVQVEPNMGYEPLDWGSGGGGGDQTLFDLTSTVDHAYWSQSQWTSSDDQDHNGLYLP